MKNLKSRIILASFTTALMLAPQTALAQETETPVAPDVAAVELVVGALENPPALSDIEQFDGEVQVVGLTELQSGITAATIESVDMRVEENDAWLEELHTAVAENAALSAALETEEMEVESVIALAIQEDGSFVVYVDDREQA